jgi:hypothetical protein
MTQEKRITSNPIKDLTLEEAQKLISLCGVDVTVFVEGEPGIGKSTLLKMLKTSLGDDYDYVYVDCPLIDLPDFAMPYVQEGVTHYAPSSLWKLKSTKPKVIMLDEVSKAPNVVKPMFTRLMLERCIGEFDLPAGSIVFATGNRASDGVGDTMQGHINNRVTKVNIGKPSVEAWVNWAIDNKVNESVIAAVHAMPNVLQSYLEDANNPYIFNPKKNTGAYASPRSLTKAGKICDQRTTFGNELTVEALKGTIGVAFALQMMAYLYVADTLPTWADIEKAPGKTIIPKSPAAQLLLLFGSIGQVNNKNAEAYTKYFFRFETELRMLWARQFKSRLEHVMGVAEFRKTLVEDHWVFA